MPATAPGTNKNRIPGDSATGIPKISCVVCMYSQD